jgi:hypothetical protein
LITDGYFLILLLRIRATPGLVLRILQASPKDWMRRKNAENLIPPLLSKR